MADYTLGLTDEGIYEIPLAAGVAKTIAVTSGKYVKDGLVFQQISGASPVYGKAGTAIVPQDPKSVMVVTGQWASFINELGTKVTTFVIVSAAAAVVSVYRNE